MTILGMVGVHVRVVQEAFKGYPGGFESVSEVFNADLFLLPCFKYWTGVLMVFLEVSLVCFMKV